MTNYPAVLRALRTFWETVDPAPAGLADRVLLALQLRDLDFELLRSHDPVELVGARGAGSTATLTFSSESFTMMVSLSPSDHDSRRLDGWLAPAAALRVELRTLSGIRATVADPNGRFAFDDVPAGPARLVVHPPDAHHTLLDHSVATPAFEI